MMVEKKVSQIGASSTGREYLRTLAGRSSESGAKADKEGSEYSTFGEMKDAYRILFIYGLTKGERLPTKKFNTIYAQLSMLSDPYDFETLISNFGEEGDLEDIGKAINEYTNWAIEDVKKKFPDGKISVEQFSELFD